MTGVVGETGTTVDFEAGGLEPEVLKTGVTVTIDPAPEEVETGTRQGSVVLGTGEAVPAGVGTGDSTACVRSCFLRLALY